VNGIGREENKMVRRKKREVGNRRGNSLWTEGHF